MKLLKRKKEIPPYLDNLCNGIDYITTALEGEDNWREQIIKVIYDNLQDFNNATECDFNRLLKDMQEFIKED
ncbi:MAG: hypothetical protein DRG78_20185 [Epsilonproteobacteria bacterium]|nr:MAG: hypothetical protein DRG78_20185 [Campylobacterota bacterium]